MRIYLTAAAVIAAFFLSISTVPCRGAGRVTPGNLTCEYARNPSVIDATAPRLSWINTSNQRGEMQTAYQIRVASSRKSLRRADLWNSGRVASDDSYLVKYAGTELASGQECWWQVRVWDSAGRRSRWSSPARWGMGLLDKADWKAQWIGAPWQGEEGRDIREGHEFSPSPLLRKSVEIKGKVASAKAYVTGLGFFQFYVNGRKIGDEQLTPNETMYGYREGLENHGLPMDGTKFRGYRVNYLGYDITDCLVRGENVFGAMLGCGFFDVKSGWAHSYGTPRFLAQIEIKYADGTAETVVSDCSWLSRKGPVTKDGMYDGETYDATLEVDGWCEPGTDTSGWEPAVPRKAPEGKLCAHSYTSDRIMERVAPKSITRLEDGSLELDFGDYLTGWLHLSHIDGAAGDTIKMTYLCESAGNGPNDYVMKGSGDEDYAARFTWFCFDKVRISGYPGELLPENAIAEAVYADVETTGHFACSNGLFNRINHIWWRSQTDNMHLGVPTDCPQREKGPYTGDGQLACVTVMHNFDAANFYTKWLKDIADCQNVETGYVTNGAPWHPGCGGGVGWGAAMNIIPWQFYLHYGDKDVLEQYYYAMTEEIRWMLSWVNEDGIMHQQMYDPQNPVYFLNLGEWLPPYGIPKDELIHTYVLWTCLDCTSKAAAVLGKDGDCVKYRSLAGRTAEAFHKQFYDEKEKTYGDYGCNIIALRMGVPEERYDDVIQTLKDEIARYDGHLDTGIIATQIFFETLADNGLNELAFEAMNKRDFPSFGWWIEQGAYTTWENWNGRDSRNHPMFGGSLNWFYRKVAGMNVDEDNPGYRHIIFKPMPCGDLTWAEYGKRTPYGDAGIRWDLADGVLTQKVTVPVGCTATVYLPQQDGSYETEEVGSGTFEFRSRMR